MGAFFTNVQARVPDAVDDAAQRVVAAVTELVRPLRPCAPDETADREVVIVAERGWVSVYDEGTEGQDDARLDALAVAVGVALGGPAFGVLVHDSDVLKLDLVRGGAVVHRYDSNPGYFGRFRGKRRAPEEVAATWADALGVEPSGDLERVFDPDALFAEAALPVLAGVLGLDAERLAVGHRYLDEVTQLRARATVLRFRSDERPPWERTRSGPPRLITEWQQAEEMAGQTIALPPRPPTLVGEGGPAAIGVTAISAGGPSLGLELVLEGGPDVRWERVQLVSGDPRHATERPEVPLVRDGDRWTGAFPTAAIPAGREPMGPLELQQAMLAGANVRQAMSARFQSQVRVNVFGTGGTPSAGDVRLTLQPVAGEGTTTTVSLQVVSTAARPLRAPASVHPMLVAPLLGRDRLVALVTLDQTGAATELLQRVAPHLPVVAKVRVVRHPAPGGGLMGMLKGLAGGQAPKMSYGKASGFFTSARFTKLIAEVPATTIQATAEGVDDAEAVEGRFTVQLGTSLFPRVADPLPTLALSMRTAGLDADVVQAVLRDAIDACAASGSVVQALLTRWGAPATVDTSPYESAVGIHGTATGGRHHRERWLRAVGPGAVWLGPALRAHVPGVPGTEVGGTLRVDVTDVAAAERALAAVLPTPADLHG